MPNWINLSNITGSGDSAVSITASSSSVVYPRTASYKVYTPEGESKVVSIMQLPDINLDELTEYFNVTETGTTRVCNFNFNTDIEGMVRPEKIYVSIDGGAWEEMTLPTGEFGYGSVTFNSTGIHYVQYRFVNPSDTVLQYFYDKNVNSSTCTMIGVYIPSKFKIIGKGAFDDWGTNSTVQFAIIDNGVTDIRELAFGGCRNLSYVSLPSSLRIIEDYAFSTTGFKSVTLPYGVISLGKRVEETGGGLAFQNGVFTTCTNLEDVYIPDSVIELGKGVFSECNKLKHIRLSNNISEIPSIAFAFHRNNRTDISEIEIDIPDNVVTICKYAFQRNTGLKELHFSSNSLLTRYDDFCFANCMNLRRITIPKLVTSIGHMGYLGKYADTTPGTPTPGVCSEIYSYAEVPPTYLPSMQYNPIVYGNGPFTGLPNNGVLHYPAGSDYSSWLANTEGYPGYYGWTGVADL